LRPTVLGVRDWSYSKLPHYSKTIGNGFWIIFDRLVQFQKTSHPISIIRGFQGSDSIFLGTKEPQREKLLALGEAQH
jgi:hypothetical protein